MWVTQAEVHFSFYISRAKQFGEQDLEMLLAMIVFWRKEWQPAAVFLPGKSHGQRSLVGYNPWSPKGLDMT